MESGGAFVFILDPFDRAVPLEGIGTQCQGRGWTNRKRYAWPVKP